MRRDLLGVLLVLTLDAAAMCGRAAPSGATLLPEDTKFFISIPDPAELDKGWKRTQLQALLQDPKLKPFIDELDQRGGLWLNTGLLWDDLRAAAGGEICWGTVQPAAGQVANILLIDAKGKKEAADRLLAKAAAHLQKRGLTRQQKDLAGAQVQVFTPATPGDKTVFFGFKDNLVTIADHEALVQRVYEGLAGSSKVNLAETRPYKEVMARAQAQVKDSPHVKWFVEPIGLAETQRVGRTQPKRRGPDYLKIFKEEGFTAFQGVGGIVTFGAGDHDFVHRTALYAPPPYQKSMRMMRVSAPGDNFTPPAWVPADVGLFGTLYLDIATGYKSVGSLFDATVFEGETGTWDDVLKDLREDPNGPQVDVSKEIIGRLGKRVTYLADTVKPIGHYSSRMLIAVETGDEQGLAQALRRLVQDDPDIKPRKFKDDILLWEIPPIEKKSKKSKGEVSKAPRAAVGVARGHLFLSSHIEFLEKILSAPKPGLADDAAYQRVTKEFGRFGAEAHWLRFFSRPDVNLETVYEMARRKELSETRAAYAQALRFLVGDSSVDASKLSEFEHIRRYLGPAGVFATNQADGWLYVGFALKKAGP